MLYSLRKAAKQSQLYEGGKKMGMGGRESSPHAHVIQPERCIHSVTIFIIEEELKILSLERSRSPFCASAA